MPMLGWEAGGTGGEIDRLCGSKWSRNSRWDGNGMGWVAPISLLWDCRPIPIPSPSHMPVPFNPMTTLGFFMKYWNKKGIVRTRRKLTRTAQGNIGNNTAALAVQLSAALYRSFRIISTTMFPPAHPVLEGTSLCPSRWYAMPARL